MTTLARAAVQCSGWSLVIQHFVSNPDGLIPYDPFPVLCSLESTKETVENFADSRRAPRKVMRVRKRPIQKVVGGSHTREGRRGRACHVARGEFAGFIGYITGF